MKNYYLLFLFFLFAVVLHAEVGVDQYPQVEDISGYSGGEEFVYETSSGSWYALNNLDQYEKWGVVELADQLAGLTTYSGKYALVGDVIYRFDDQWIATSVEVIPFVKPANGVYIIDKCGKLFSPADCPEEKDALAVAVFTDNTSAMISKRNVIGSTDIWNLGGENIPVIWGASGLVSCVAATQANGSNAVPGAVTKDYSGYNNTRLINQALNSPDNSAVKMAAGYAFGNGIRGYLPAFGELSDVKNRLSDVNSALLLIGGSPMDGLYWSSSQHYLNYRAWWVQFGSGHDSQQHFAALRNNSTPLSSSYYNACYALLRPFGKLPDYTFDDPYPESPGSLLLGDVNGDGQVDISDVAALIDYLLNDDAEDICLQNADCYMDNVINIADVVEIIDYLLNDTWSWGVETFTVNGVSFNMVSVNGGTFIMGATAEQGTSDPNSDEYPVHEVTLSSFSIGETEVTQELWMVVMGSNPSYHKGDLSCPVEYVSWNDCQTFIAKLNALTGRAFRLPTEAEWEFAARGGNYTKGFKYAGGNTINGVAWNYANSNTTTHPVAIKYPNELGLYDMSGNVSEWCQDWYGDYSGESQTNPGGPTTGTKRVNRGGSWYDNAKLCRVSNRELWSESSAAPFGTLGLRLAMDETVAPAFALSQNEVTIPVGAESVVDILQGSGNYSVTDGDSIASAIISGSQLLVTGNHVGTTQLIVTDNNTLYKAILVVNVIEYKDPIETFTVNGVSFNMVTVDGGTFIMGATDEQGTEALDREYPTHEVTLSDFRIGQSEVTQALWVAVMGDNPSKYTGDLQRPVDRVSWNACQEFITKLNELTGQSFRLPTEAEWEFAARGGNKSNGYKYAGSDALDDVAWFLDNSTDTSHPVATMTPNELDLYDMSGNVWEWCQDWYGDYTGDAQINPIVLDNGSDYRITRGGSWLNDPSYCRVSYRRILTPDNVDAVRGLRLALSL